MAGWLIPPKLTWSTVDQRLASRLEWEHFCCAMVDLERSSDSTIDDSDWVLMRWGHFALELGSFGRRGLGRKMTPSSPREGFRILNDA